MISLRKLTFCFVFLFPPCVQAELPSVRPDVKVVRIDTNLRYDASRPVTRCGPNASGCTSSVLQYAINVNCQNENIEMSFGYPEILVQIANSYQKGSVEFDAVLKHELTHVALREKILEKFYRPTASAALMQYEKSAGDGKSCAEIRSDVTALFKKYMDRLQQEVAKHDRMIDGTENYLYQSKQVAEKKSGIKLPENIITAVRPSRSPAKVKQKPVDLSLIRSEPIVRPEVKRKSATIVLPERGKKTAAVARAVSADRERGGVSFERQTQNAAAVRRNKTKEEQIIELPLFNTLDIVLTDIVDEFKLKEKFADFLRGIFGMEPTLTATGTVENKTTRPKPVQAVK